MCPIWAFCKIPERYSSLDPYDWNSHATNTRKASAVLSISCLRSLGIPRTPGCVIVIEIESRRSAWMLRRWLSVFRWLGSSCRPVAEIKEEYCRGISECFDTVEPRAMVLREIAAVERFEFRISLVRFLFKLPRHTGEESFTTMEAVVEITRYFCWAGSCRWEVNCKRSGHFLEEGLPCSSTKHVLAVTRNWSLLAS